MGNRAFTAISFYCKILSALADRCSIARLVPIYENMAYRSVRLDTLIL
jgi:hypothetical protein